jgi:hypothetical protein
MNYHMFDAGYLQEQYELLRREAVELSPYTQRGHGLLLLLTRGMAAWVEAVSCLSGRRAAPVEVTTSTLHFSLQPEIMTVLANMVLVCMQEAHT